VIVFYENNMPQPVAPRKRQFGQFRDQLTIDDGFDEPLSANFRAGDQA
jgi:hypothetical protein